MYSFSRRVHVAPGRLTDATAWAIEMADRVRETTELDLSLHAQVFSPDIGEMVFSAFVPDLATLETANDKLVNVPLYLSEVERAADLLLGSPVDAVARFVHPAGAMADVPDHPGTYASVVTTTCRAGQLTRGVTGAIELADRATEITGNQTAVLLNQTGPYSAISWATVAEDIHAIDRANEAMAADPGWPAFVDDRAVAYVDDPSATQQVVYRRIH